MKSSLCPSCGAKMKRNGKTSARRQRWRCTLCNASKTHHAGSDAKHLQEFLAWLMSRKRQSEMVGGGRSFRRRTSQFWRLWPLPVATGEIYRVVYVDGIYLGRRAVILIARSDEYVIGWYVAKTENAEAYKALMSRIAPPVIVLCDGGTGFEKARRQIWPDTAVQRCVFHVFSQVKRYTTSRPKLPAGRELYAIAKDLLYVRDSNAAIAWLMRYNDWCVRWQDFLQETTLAQDGKRVLTHERLVKAKRSLSTLIKQDTLFTYLDPTLTKDGPLPATNNKIEGAVNAQLRAMIRDHRGLSLTRRIKAVFWWCYMHTECPAKPAELLKTMPTDDDIGELFRRVDEKKAWQDSVPGLGTGVVWDEFHLSGPRPLEWD